MKLFKASDFVNDAGLFTDAYTSADRANAIVRELIEALVLIANDTSDNSDFYLNHTAQEALDHVFFNYTPKGEKP